MEESYAKRFWKRWYSDGKDWIANNVLLGIVMLIVPPIAVYLGNRNAAIDWHLVGTTLLLYLFVFAVYACVHLCLTPAKLDADRAAVVAELQEQIRKLTPPKRTPAQQDAYDIAKAAISLLKPHGVPALRYLRMHGQITFYATSCTPPPPSGLTMQNLFWVYNHCVSVGVVSCNEKFGGGEKTFTIPSRMESVLDEVLYEDQATSATH